MSVDGCESAHCSQKENIIAKYVTLMFVCFNTNLIALILLLLFINLSQI